MLDGKKKTDFIQTTDDFRFLPDCFYENNRGIVMLPLLVNLVKIKHLI